MLRDFLMFPTNEATNVKVQDRALSTMDLSGKNCPQEWYPGGRSMMRLAALMSAALAVAGCAAIKEQMEAQKRARDEQEAPMMAAFFGADGYVSTNFHAAEGGSGWAKIKFCTWMNRGTLELEIWEKRLKNLRAAGKLDELRHHYFWVSHEYPLLSVPATEADAFKRAVAAGRVCIWMDESKQVAFATRGDAGEKEYPNAPVHLVPVDRWDGVTQPHPDYQAPLPAAAEGGAPQPR